ALHESGYRPSARRSARPAPRRPRRRGHGAGRRRGDEPPRPPDHVPDPDLAARPADRQSASRADPLHGDNSAVRRRGREGADLNGSIEAELDGLSLLQLATRREADRYRTMFESAPVAFLVTDAFGKILEANTAASELLAIDPRFLAGKPLPTYVIADERGRFRRWIIDLYRGRVSDALAP